MALVSILLFKPKTCSSVPDCSLFHPVPPNQPPVPVGPSISCHRPTSSLPCPPAMAAGCLLLPLPHFCCLQWSLSNSTTSLPDLKVTGVEVSCLPASLLPTTPGAPYTPAL